MHELNYLSHSPLNIVARRLKIIKSSKTPEQCSYYLSFFEEAKKFSLTAMQRINRIQ